MAFVCEMTKKVFGLKKLIVPNVLLTTLSKAFVVPNDSLNGSRRVSCKSTSRFVLKGERRNNKNELLGWNVHLSRSPHLLCIRSMEPRNFARSFEMENSSLNPEL